MVSSEQFLASTVFQALFNIAVLAMIIRLQRRL